MFVTIDTPYTADVFDMPNNGLPPAILIVENEEDTRRLYVDVLTYTEARILEAGNPYEAFEQLRAHSISLILTDLQMPGGGIQYLRNLRHEAPTCPIIAITGLGGEMQAAAIAAGATLFLEKPIRTKQLRETVNRFLPSTPAAV